MPLLLRLPSIIATLARAFRDFSYACLAWYVMFTGEAHAPTVQQEMVQQPPQLNAEQEALLGEAYQHMATLFEVYRLDQKLQAPPSF